MNRFAWILGATLIVAPVQGVAQTAAADRPIWKADWTATANPVFGNEVDAPWGQTIIDEAEYKLNGAWTRGFSSAEVVVSATAAINPNQFDEDDRASSLALQGEVRRKYKLSEYTDEGGAPWPSQDTFMPFARYRLSTTYTNEFGDSQGASHTVTVGGVLQDIRSYVCVDRDSFVPVRSDTARCRDGLLWSFTPSLSKTWSSKEDDELLSPSGEAVLTSPLHGHPDWMVTAKAEMQTRWFDNQFIAGGDDREDQRLTVSVNLDVSRPLRSAFQWIPQDLSIQLGVRYSRNWSNLDGKDFERRYFAPSITWKRAF